MAMKKSKYIYMDMKRIVKFKEGDNLLAMQAYHALCKSIHIFVYI